MKLESGGGNKGKVSVLVPKGGGVRRMKGGRENREVQDKLSRVEIAALGSHTEEARVPI